MLASHSILSTLLNGLDCRLDIWAIRLGDAGVICAATAARVRLASLATALSKDQQAGLR